MLATILLILQVLPSILAAITQIENIFKGISAMGAIKKQVIMDNLEGQDPKTVSVVSSVIDRSVKSFNKAGVFTHGTGVDTPPAPMPTAQQQNNTATTEVGTASGNIGSRT